MSTNWDDVNVRCPFYLESGARKIRCEGPWPGSGIHLQFQTGEIRKEIMAQYCKSCYEKCPIFKLAARKYE